MPDSSIFEPGQPLHVRLYGRPDCKLCNEAAVLLNTLHSDYDFWVEKINIDDDPAIQEKLQDHIPVATFNGGNRVTAPMTEEKLRRAFKKALRSEDKDHTTEAAAAA
jgi:arsenate reductase-like glutaredoxin family protein